MDDEASGEQNRQNNNNTNENEIVSWYLNLQDRNGRTALHYACSSASHPVSIASSLVQLNANMRAQDKEGNTALLCAAQSSNLRSLAYLLELSPTDVIDSNKEGYTALHVCFFLNLSSLEILLKNFDSIQRLKLVVVSTLHLDSYIHFQSRTLKRDNR